MKQEINDLVCRIENIHTKYVTEEITAVEKRCQIETAKKTVTILFDARVTAKNRAILDELSPALNRTQLELVKRALYGNSTL